MGMGMGMDTQCRALPNRYIVVLFYICIIKSLTLGDVSFNCDFNVKLEIIQLYYTDETIKGWNQIREQCAYVGWKFALSSRRWFTTPKIGANLALAFYYTIYVISCKAHYLWKI